MNRTQADMCPLYTYQHFLVNCFYDTFMREEQMGCQWYSQELPTSHDLPLELHWAVCLMCDMTGAAGNSLHHSSLFPKCSPSHMSFKPRTFQGEVNQPSADSPGKLMSYLNQGLWTSADQNGLQRQHLTTDSLTGSDTGPSGVLYSGAIPWEVISCFNVHL